MNIDLNSLIEERLIAEYKQQKQEDEDFKEYIAYHASDKSLSTELPLCFIPEFKKGENYLFKDQRPDFQADQEYERDKALCLQALGSINDESGNYIFQEVFMLNFYNNYKDLYKRLIDQWNYSAYHDFRCLFFFLIDWVKYFELAEKAKEAIKELNPYNEDDIEDWLYDYNRLYFCNSLFWGFLGEQIDEENHLYRFRNEYFNAYIEAEEITQCIEFGETYNMHKKKADGERL